MIKIKNKINSNNIDEFLNKIIHGDSLEILKKIPKETIDITITSPPYDDLRDYNDSILWDFEIFKKIAKQIYRVTKEGGVVVWVVGDKTENGNKSLTSFKQCLFFQTIGFNVYDVIIYEKSGTGPPHNKRYFNCFEYMFILSKGIPKSVNILKDKPNKWAGQSTFGNVTRREKDGTLTNKGVKTINEFGARTNIWRYNNGKNFSTKDKIAYEHPAIFPEELVRDNLMSWSIENDIVLDVFGGSGTTAKVAKELNRKWIYIEKVEKYCEIAKKRLL
jgi:DNA modification methylase